MTYLEKLKADNPAWDDAKVRNYIIDYCPKGVDARMVVCPYGPGSILHEVPNEIRCTMCWNHEISCPMPPDGNVRCTYDSAGERDCKACRTANNEANEREETKMEATTTTRKTKAQLLEEIEGLKAEMDRLKRYEKYEESANEMFAMMESFMNSGFTRDEAFIMVGKMLENAVKMATR